MALEFETIGKSFVNVYYEAFDVNRANLASLYRYSSFCSKIDDVTNSFITKINNKIKDISGSIGVMLLKLGTSNVPQTPQSMMTFEGQQFQGSVEIMKKLTGLPFTRVKHIITTIDCQPTTANGVTVFVVGQLKTDDDPPHGFSQTFILVPGPNAASYFVLNDMFRLSLHHG